MKQDKCIFSATRDKKIRSVLLGVGDMAKTKENPIKNFREHDNYEPKL